MITTSNDLPQFVRDLMASCPRAGEGVNPYLYVMARVLHPYRTEEEICEMLRCLTAGCGRIVTEQEIQRAVENSKAAAWVPGKPKLVRSAPPWPTVNEEQRQAVLSEGYRLVDLWEESTHRFEDNEPHTERIIDVLFPGNPLLCCCGKRRTEFATRPREEWRGKLSDRQFIVPSPMSARTGLTKQGKKSQHTLSNTGARRFLVIEFDSGSLDDHAALLRHLSGRWPLALVVNSGSKSLHGWFYCHGQPEEDVREFMRRAVSLGADPMTWIRSQFVRMPDGTRDDGRRQRAFFLNPEVIKP